MQNEEVQQETVSDNDADEINQVPTESDPINALSTLQSFLQNSEGGYDRLKNLEKRSDFVFKFKNPRGLQSNITDFQSGWSYCKICTMSHFIFWKIEMWT